MKVKLLLCLSLVTSLLLGCSTYNKSFTPLITVPLQAPTTIQSKVYQLEGALENDKITTQEKMDYLIELGIYYDMLGLYDLSYVKYAQALDIQPNQHVYNAIGLYYTLKQEFDLAFEVLDTALVLDPGYDYAKFNRAVALYYAERYELAFDDINKTYNANPHDPFRALWRYIIQYEISPSQALQELKAIYEPYRDGSEWGWELVGMMADEKSPDDLLAQVVEGEVSNYEAAKKLSEFYFYLAKKHQENGDELAAINLYKLSLSQNVYEYIEHKYSMVELEKFFNKLNHETTENQTSIQ